VTAVDVSCGKCTVKLKGCKYDVLFNDIRTEDGKAKCPDNDQADGGRAGEGCDGKDERVGGDPLLTVTGFTLELQVRRYRKSANGYIATMTNECMRKWRQLRRYRRPLSGGSGGGSGRGSGGGTDDRRSERRWEALQRRRPRRQCRKRCS
jgi:hypothetical protein